MSTITLERQGEEVPLWQIAEQIKPQAGTSCCTFSSIASYVPPGEKNGHLMIESHYCAAYCGGAGIRVVQPTGASARELLEASISEQGAAIPLGRNLVTVQLSTHARSEANETWKLFEWDGTQYKQLDEVFREWRMCC
jgi:hypothetical protein